MKLCKKGILIAGAGVLLVTSGLTYSLQKHKMEKDLKKEIDTTISTMIEESNGKISSIIYQDIEFSPIQNKITINDIQMYDANTDHPMISIASLDYAKSKKNIASGVPRQSSIKINGIAISADQYAQIELMIPKPIQDHFGGNAPHGDVEMNYSLTKSTVDVDMKLAISKVGKFHYSVSLAGAESLINSLENHEEIPIISEVSSTELSQKKWAEEIEIRSLTFTIEDDGIISPSLESVALLKGKPREHIKKEAILTLDYFGKMQQSSNTQNAVESIKKLVSNESGKLTLSINAKQPISLKEFQTEIESSNGLKMESIANKYFDQGIEYSQ